MRTSAQALHDAIASGAVAAWHRGEKIQVDVSDKTGWITWRGDSGRTPAFGDPDLTWRLTPAKRRIPFTQLTVPKGALWKMNREDAQSWHLATSYGFDCIRLPIGPWTYENAANELVYSLDGGATWQPGSQEVES